MKTSSSLTRRRAPSRMRRCIAVLTSAWAATVSFAFDFTSFKTDEETDRWLCDHSSTYARIVQDFKARKELRGYRFSSREEVVRGMAVLLDGCMEIQLNPALSGADRVNVLLFEMANASRHGDHEQIDRAVDAGVIRTPGEFGLAHEMVEYEALRVHRQMLVELEARVQPLPREFFYFVTPAAQSTREYHLPGLSQYLKAQQESGHTGHYYEIFRLRTSGRDWPKQVPKDESRRPTAPSVPSKGSDK